MSDDFIKFIRLSQYLLDTSRRGVLGMITNNVFIDGITHRRMREALLSTFGSVRVLDLHGSSKKLEKAPDGSRDENVFDIQQGVGISLFAMCGLKTAAVRHSDLWGSRGAKYSVLSRISMETTPWVTVESSAPHFFFLPKSFARADEYRGFFRLADVFPAHNAGIQTKNDAFVYAMSRRDIEERVADLKTERPERLVTKYELSQEGHWSLRSAQQDVCRNKGDVVQVLNKPFDKRWTYYTGKTSGLMARPRAPVMRSGLIPNRIVLTVRNPRRGNTDSFFVADTIVDKDGVSPFDNVTVFPLFLPAETGDGQSFLLPSSRLNISEGFMNALRQRLSSAAGLRYLQVGQAVQDIFSWAYAVFHSAKYRTRYQEFLKIDFPRLPLPSSLGLFHDLALLGSELVSLHLMESPKLNDFITTYIGPKNPEVGRVRWSNYTVWLDAAATKKDQPATPGTIGFRGVAEAVWNFHIGGYRVCERWLKDRKGRTLSDDDIAHYQKIVVALAETIRLMKEIDEVIEQHGGWPAAFQTRDAKAVTAEVTPFRPRIVEPKPEDRYVTCVPLVPLKAAAGAFSDPQHTEDDDFEWAAVDSKHRLRPGMFIAQVAGRSMEPVIPDGAYCLFAAPVTGTRQGKTVLVQLRDATDPETGERYTVKRYASEKTKDADSWRHSMITLKPVNPDFEPIVLTGADEGQFQVVAELIEVLSSNA